MLREQGSQWGGCPEAGGERSWPYKQAGKKEDMQLEREWERRCKVAMPINIQFGGTHVRKTWLFPQDPKKMIPAVYSHSCLDRDHHGLSGGKQPH